MTIKKARYGPEDLKREVGPITFGGLLSCYRLCEKMSQREFAKLLGISPSSLCDLEKGRATPSISRAGRIAKKLKASEELFIEKALETQLKKEGFKKFSVFLDERPTNRRSSKKSPSHSGASRAS